VVFLCLVSGADAADTGDRARCTCDDADLETAGVALETVALATVVLVTVVAPAEVEGDSPFSGRSVTSSVDLREDGVSR